jgi:hypothetical protein
MNDTELVQQLAVTQERSRLLQDELAETNRGLSPWSWSMESNSERSTMNWRRPTLS